MKIKLLNRGGFYGLMVVSFPVEVEAEYHELGRGAVRVNSSELCRIGGSYDAFTPGRSYTFFANEIEVVS